MSSCNVCNSSLEGIAFRTSCNHLLCPACAQRSFCTGRQCPICSAYLTSTSVNEVAVGLSPTISILETLLQGLLSKNSNLEELVDNFKSIQTVWSDVQMFLISQLYFELQKEKRFKLSVVEELHTQNDELAKSNGDIKLLGQQMETRCVELENLLTTRDQELGELKNAYKEKMRKCAAWEKAYNALRSQIVETSSMKSDSRPQIPLPRESQSIVHQGEGKQLYEGLEAYQRGAMDRNGSGKSTINRDNSFPKMHSVMGSTHQQQNQDLSRTYKRTETTQINKRIAPGMSSNQGYRQNNLGNSIASSFTRPSSDLSTFLQPTTWKAHERHPMSSETVYFSSLPPSRHELIQEQRDHLRDLSDRQERQNPRYNSTEGARHTSFFDDA